MGAKEAKAGDRVLVKTPEEEIEGLLMERPEILDKDVTVIKLDNGYNIGIENKKIKKLAVVEPYKPKAVKKKASKSNPKLPNISILSFGGTITSKIDYKTGGVTATGEYTAEDFVKMCPELEKIANINTKSVMSIMSEDISANEWAEMAKAVAEELNKKEVDGVVVTMGTDTLHFASAALSFMLTDFNKPVVFTASQRSIDRGSSDAFMNLICAVISAKSDFAGVFTCMHGTINDDYCLLVRGTKVRKMHTSRRDAFRPINEEPIAKITTKGKIDIINENYNKRADKEVLADVKFEEKTALVQAYPGLNPEIIDFYSEKGYKGIVIAATALGHVATKGKYSLLPSIKRAIEKGVAVIIASQTLYGRTHPYVYTNLRKLSVDLGCIFAEDMTPETAYIKLGFVLGHESEPEKIRELMCTNIAGEINARHSPDIFLN